MTNIYGTEPHDHEQGHDEVLTHENDVVREPPSDYEFSDDHSATVSEEHNDDPAVSGAEAKAGRRSAALPIAAAVGGILLLGGVAWWQFGGSSSSQNVPPVPAIGQISSALPAATAPKTADSPPSPMANVAPTTSSAAMPMDATSSVATPVVTAQMPSAAPVPANGATDQRIDALAAHMDDLQKALDQVTQQLGQVTNMVSASVNANAPNKDIQDRLDKIEQQLAALHHPAPKLAAPAALPGEAPVAANSTIAASKPVRHHEVVVKKIHKIVASKPVVEAKAPAPSWILRAASPGQAWIATSATSHDLKQVQVGDTLEGIGKVTAISQSNGSWVVQGTKGAIQ